MDKLEIHFTGLGTSWNKSNNPIVPDPIDPFASKEQIDKQYGTPEERQALMDAILPLVEINQQIPTTSEWTLPGAMITLELPPNATAHKSQYPIPIAYKKKLYSQMKDWWDHDIITLAPANTTFNSPLLFVKKKNVHGEYTGDARITIDIRLVNQQLLNNDRFILPAIKDLHQKMSAFQLFSTIDLKQCFHRFPMKKSCQPYTSCAVPSKIKVSFYNSASFSLKDPLK